jgi:hypothetical protein
VKKTHASVIAPTNCELYLLLPKIANVQGFGETTHCTTLLKELKQKTSKMNIPHHLCRSKGKQT